MDELAKNTQRILLSVLTGHQNVSAIRTNTRIHPKTLSNYLKLLDKRGLIEVETKGWKKGKSKPCFITNDGITWLINTSLNETLRVLSKIIHQLKSTKTREIFQKTKAERYSRNMKIIKNYFIERLLRENKSPIEYPDGMELTDPDQPFREALKKLFALHLYLISNPIQMFEDPERAIEKDFILFAPNMRFMFSWHPGSFPELEYQLSEVDKYYRRESEKLERRKEGETISGETHLLGLETVDEKIYDEYVKATNETHRARILTKIEDEVGWSVGKYLQKLLIGKETEIARYIDESQRPCLRKFISLFET